MKVVIKLLLAIVINIYLGYVFCPKARATIVFSIGNPTVDAGDIIQVDATISGLISSSCSVTGCYLQAELQSAGGYFGYTYNNSGDFVDYFKNPISTDDIKSKLFNFVPVSGSWTGKLEAENNAISSFYYGPGDYLLSFRRFSGNSTNPTTDSNSVSVSLSLPTPTPSPTDTPQPSMTPTPSDTPYVLKTAPPSPTPTSTPTKIPTPTPTRTPIPITSPKPTDSPISLVLGEETVLNSPTPQDLPQVSPDIKNTFPFWAVGLVVIGLGFVGLAIYSIMHINNVKKEDPQIS